MKRNADSFAFSRKKNVGFIFVSDRGFDASSENMITPYSHQDTPDSSANMYAQA
jgi:hypothetical protein